jgi:hypothetical protein
MRKSSDRFSVLFFICFIYLGCIDAKCQHLRSNRLFDFMKDNFDSTIIYFPFSNWSAYPNYYIIAQKGKKNFLFTYLSPYEQLVKYPDSLRSKFSSMHLKFQFTEPDINEYFIPIKSEDSLSEIFWSRILKNDIWNLTGTTDEIFCTAKDSTKYGINDGEEEYFFLITKSGKKSVYFYAPAFFEEHCPGNINRIKAIKIMGLFNTAFKRD